MKQVQGIWLPEDDTHFETMFRHFPEYDGAATYQFDKLQACLKRCNNRRVAVDIGAHVGLWSRVLADEFREVIAFEPVFSVPFRRNLEKKSNVRLYEVALSDSSGSVQMDIIPGNSGNTHIACASSNPAISVPMTTLDTYNLQDVDFIKVDVEGWEFPVLAGAEATLRRCKPVVIFEQKGHDKRFYGETQDCMGFMKSLGASLVAVKGDDIIMRWENGDSSSQRGL